MKRSAYRRFLSACAMCTSGTGGGPEPAANVVNKNEYVTVAITFRLPRERAQE